MFCSKCGKQAEGEFCWNCGAKLYVPPSDDVKQDSNSVPLAKQKPLAPYSSFRPTAEYPLATGSFEIDSVHQMIRFMPTTGYNGVYFHYQDIIDAELVQNGSSVFKTSTSSMITRSIIGSAISRDFGIIAGATAKVNEKKYIDELYIRVLLKTPTYSNAKIPLINERVPQDSILSRIAMDKIETVLAQIRLAQNTPPVETAYAQYGLSTVVHEPKPQNISIGNQNWRCPECDYSNGGTVSNCINCGEPRPGVHRSRKPVGHTVSADPAEPLPLPSSDLYDDKDWFCPKCDLKNKATNKTCPNCGTVRPVPGIEQRTDTEKKGLLGRFKK
ncbi:MAG: hypothetical protein J1F11_03425 [Oscillospiraceae bacterium]|nr:hypothetical protein [Oscillospiraceae bacterium]